MNYYQNSTRFLRSIIEKEFGQIKEEKGLSNLPSHLLWMLSEVDNMGNSSKAGRWIGYVIGRLESLGVLNNKKAREIIRDDVADACD